ncbi:MAG: AAA family ATPase [Actinomycetota bacterium]
MPPYLAGRQEETTEFEKLLGQTRILENLVLTGLRGVGKTVLLETFKPLAIKNGWLWVGTDLSEAVSVSEVTLATRLLTDLSLVTSTLTVPSQTRKPAGFNAETEETRLSLDHAALTEIFNETPGLVYDKVKRVLEVAWEGISGASKGGLIFAYDEAQNLADRQAKDQYPLSLLLDVFQSIQRAGIPFMLVLTGLPTLFPKLVEARTFSERMFRVMMLDKLDRDDSRAAIEKPIEDADSPVAFTEAGVEQICDHSGGYPYFIQFICREIYDVIIQKTQDQKENPFTFPMDAIIKKLDTDFFSGRWARPTDRQRELLRVIASLEHPDTEFTVQDVVEKSKHVLDKPFSSSHVNQMLAALCEMGLTYKNRWGKYSFAVPLFGEFIIRQIEKENEAAGSSV